jgi:hypothetical protein
MKDAVTKSIRRRVFFFEVNLKSNSVPQLTMFSHRVAQNLSQHLCVSCFISGLLFLTTTSQLIGQESVQLATGEAVINRIDGQSQRIVNFSIDESGKLSGEGVPAGLALDDLQELILGATAPVAPQIVMQLAGGELFASELRILDERCLITSSIGKIELGVEAIKAVRLKPQTKVESFELALRRPLESMDQIFIAVDNQFERIEGILESIDAGKVSFEYQGDTSKLPLDRLYGFVMAGIAEDANRKVNAKLFLKDGSQFTGRIKSSNAEKMLVNVGIFADVEIPLNAIARITIRSSKLVYLSDLDPVSEKQDALIVSVKRPWQRDLSIMGNPLTLAIEGGKKNQQFRKGLGLTAGSELLFENDGAFNEFAATIGIDSETNRHGDCIFKVFGDGQELFNERVQGTDDARDIKIDIAGVKQLKILVEPGEYFDLADHADWCNARMLKTD